MVYSPWFMTEGLLGPAEICSRVRRKGTNYLSAAPQQTDNRIVFAHLPSKECRAEEDHAIKSGLQGSQTHAQLR